MAEHTPGPWDFDTEHGTIEAGGTSVAGVNDEVGADQEYANGYLLAAAPDLLAALYAAQAAFAPETIADPTFDPHGAVGRDEAVVTMLAAIAKARGEASRAS